MKITLMEATIRDDYKDGWNYYGVYESDEAANKAINLISKSRALNNFPPLDFRLTSTKLFDSNDVEIKWSGECA